jgi:hypothetical protein
MGHRLHVVTRVLRRLGLAVEPELRQRRDGYERRGARQKLPTAQSGFSHA